MTTKTKRDDARQRFTELRAEIADARAERDRLKAKLDVERERIMREADGGHVKTTGPEFERASAISLEYRAADEKLAGLLEQEVALLTLLGEGGPAVANGGNAGAVAALTAEPGAWLSHVLRKRRRDVPNLPDSVRFGGDALGFAGGMAGPTILTDDYSTVAESQAAIDLMAPQSVALASGIIRIPIDTTKTRIPRFTELPAAAWIAELGQFPKSAPGVEMAEVEPPKVGLVAGLSLEVFEDLSPLALALVQRNVVRAVALEFDSGVLFGSGAAPEPRGVANTPGILVESGDLASLAVFARAIAALIAENAVPRAVVINPVDFGTLLELTEFTGATTSKVPLLKAAIGTAGFEIDAFPGLKWWLTPAAPQGTALVYDPAQVAAIIRKELDLAVDPFFGFDTGEVGLRVYLRGDVLVGQATGVCLVDVSGS